MSNITTFTGDPTISINGELDYDLNYENGQPDMTDGFDNAVNLAVFGEPDFWQNGITDDPNEKYISEFPKVIKNGSVDNDTINDGIQALNNALKFMITIKACEEINITGGALSVYGLFWVIEIVKGGISGKYTINWNRGIISMGGTN